MKRTPKKPDLLTFHSSHPPLKGNEERESDTQNVINLLFKITASKNNLKDYSRAQKLLQEVLERLQAKQEPKPQKIHSTFLGHNFLGHNRAQITLSGNNEHESNVQDIVGLLLKATASKDNPKNYTKAQELLEDVSASLKEQREQEKEIEREIEQMRQFSKQHPPGGRSHSF